MTSAVDGEVDAAERDALIRLVQVLSADSERGWLEGRLAQLSKAAATEAIGSEIDAIGRGLKASNAAGAGLAATAAVALVSHGMSLGELTAFRRMAAAAGAPEDSLGAIVEAAEAALSTKSA